MTDSIPILERIAALCPEFGHDAQGLEELLLSKQFNYEHIRPGSPPFHDCDDCTSLTSDGRIAKTSGDIICRDCARAHYTLGLKVVRVTEDLTFRFEYLRGQGGRRQVYNNHELNPWKIRPTHFDSVETFIRWKYIYKWLGKNEEIRDLLRELESMGDVDAEVYHTEAQAHLALWEAWLQLMANIHFQKQKYFRFRSRSWEFKIGAEQETLISQTQVAKEQYLEAKQALMVHEAYLDQNVQRLKQERAELVRVTLALTQADHERLSLLCANSYSGESTDSESIAFMSKEKELLQCLLKFEVAESKSLGSLDACTEKVVSLSDRPYGARASNRTSGQTANKSGFPFDYCMKKRHLHKIFLDTQTPKREALYRQLEILRAARKVQLERQAEDKRQAEVARRAKEAEQAESERQAKLARRAEKARRAEARRHAEVAKQAAEARQMEMEQQAKLARQAKINRRHQYQALVGPTHFRLLKVFPGSHQDDIECSLRTFDLADGDLPLFEALSYEWRSRRHPEPAPPSRLIVKNGTELLGSICVGNNLYRFIKRIRHAEDEIWIWADAVCINQESLDEKGHQVRLMGRIYEQADKVLAWLDAPDKSLESLRWFASATSYGPSQVHSKYWWRSSGEEGCREVMDIIFRLPYWTRKWIIQEIILARTVVLMLSDGEFAMREVEDAMISQEKLHMRRYPRSLPFAKLAIHRWNKRNSRTTAYPRTLSELLPMYESNDCKEPMDHVYALYNLIGDHREHLEVDYRQSQSTWCQKILLFLDKYEAPGKNNTIAMALRLVRLAPQARFDEMMSFSGEAPAEVTAVALDRGAIRPAEESAYSIHLRDHVEALHPGLRWTFQSQSHTAFRLSQKTATNTLERVSRRTLSFFEQPESQLYGMATMRVRDGDYIWQFLGTQFAFVCRSDPRDKSLVQVLGRCHLFKAPFTNEPPFGALVRATLSHEQPQQYRELRITELRLSIPDLFALAHSANDPGWPHAATELHSAVTESRAQQANPKITELHPTLERDRHSRGSSPSSRSLHEAVEKTRELATESKESVGTALGMPPPSYDATTMRHTS